MGPHIGQAHSLGTARAARPEFARRGAWSAGNGPGPSRMQIFPISGPKPMEGASHGLALPQSREPGAARPSSSSTASMLACSS